MTFCEMHKNSGGCEECPNRWVCENSPLNPNTKGGSNSEENQL
jgi:hypothetical protein